METCGSTYVNDAFYSLYFSEKYIFFSNLNQSTTTREIWNSGFLSTLITCIYTNQVIHHRHSHQTVEIWCTWAWQIFTKHLQQCLTLGSTKSHFHLFANITHLCICVSMQSTVCKTRTQLMFLWSVSPYNNLFTMSCICITHNPTHHMTIIITM